MIQHVHIIGNRNLLTDLIPEQRKINWISPNPVYSTHIGKTVLEAVLPGRKACKIPVSQVLYISGLKYNLISRNVSSEKGLRADLKKGDNKLIKSNKVWCLLKEEGNDLIFHTTGSENACIASTQERWHQRLCHMPGKIIVELKKHVVDLEEIITDARAACDACELASLLKRFLVTVETSSVL
jgi:hypothetical protein